MADKPKIDDHKLTLPKDVWNKESKELRTAIYDDWKRKAINDAKMRAVEQNVDYPTFANLVSVAHLKPVERKMPGEEELEKPAHIFRGASPPAWSFDSAGAEMEEEDGEEGSGRLLPALLGLHHSAPERLITDAEFVKNWRRLNKDVFLQLAFLTGIDPGDYPAIFKVEVPPSLLADILFAICTCFRAEETAPERPETQRLLLRAACAREVDENWTVRMLEGMGKCGGFSLAIGFVGEKTCAMIRALISRLVDSEWCRSDDSPPSRLCRIQNIAAVYKLQAEKKTPRS